MRVRDHLEQNNSATGHIDYAAQVEEHLARKKAAIKDMQHEAELLELEIIETYKKYIDYNFTYIEPAAKWATMLRTNRDASGKRIDLRKKYPEKVAFQELEATLAEVLDVAYYAINLSDVYADFNRNYTLVFRCDGYFWELRVPDLSRITLDDYQNVGSSCFKMQLLRGRYDADHELSDGFFVCAGATFFETELREIFLEAKSR